jgi:hypothetical protein
LDTSITIFSLAYIVILIFPGIIFKRFFFQGAFSGQFNSGLFADRIITSLFWGILVQIISVLTFSRIINVSYQDWRLMLKRFYGQVVQNKLPEISSEQLLNALFYAVYSVAIASILGFFLFRLIRLFGLDLRFPVFRFLNQWHYYFKGEILQTREFRQTPRGRDLSTEVDVMLKDDNGKSNLFCGLLTQYTLGSKNELESLYLTGATRFSQSSNSMKVVPGDIFVIPFSTVKNLNIRYNFQVRQNTELAKYILLSVSAIILIFCLIYPWTINLSLWRKILGGLSLFATWIFFSITLMSLVPPSNGATPLSLGAKITTIIALVALAITSSIILQVITF